MPEETLNAWAWSPTRLALLGGTPLGPDAMSHRAKLTDLLAELMSSFQRVTNDFVDVELDVWLWACGCLESRTMKLVDGEAVTLFMVPLADLANHGGLGANVPSLRLSDTKTAVELRAHTVIQAGSEFLLNYGPLTNTQLLMHYGFVLQNNPKDQVALLLEFPSGEEAGYTEIKQSLLMLLADEGASMTHDLCNDVSVMETRAPALLYSLRIVHFSEAEVDDFTAAFMQTISDKKQFARAYYSRTYSRVNEQRVLNYLHGQRRLIDTLLPTGDGVVDLYLQSRAATLRAALDMVLHVAGASNQS